MKPMLSRKGNFGDSIPLVCVEKFQAISLKDH